MSMQAESNPQTCAWDSTPSFVSPTRIPPVIISYSEPGSSFHNIGSEDLNKIYDSILDLAGEPLDSNVMIGGDLKILPKDSAQQQKLLNITSIGGKPVKTSLPKSVSVVLGIIRGVPTDLADDYLRESLKDQGVTDIRRLRRMSGDSPVVSGNVTLTFRSSLPDKVKVSNLSFSVMPFYQTPYRCRKCQILGHTTARCKATEASCPTCCKIHDVKVVCSQWCINCSKPDHLASSPQCREFLLTKEALKMSSMKRISVAEAKEILRAMEEATGAKQIQASPVVIGEVQRLKEQVASLQREMIDLKSTKLPTIVSSLSNLDNKTDRINDRVEGLESSLNARLEGFSRSQKDVKSTMEERFNSLEKLILGLGSTGSHQGSSSVSSAHGETSTINDVDDQHLNDTNSGDGGAETPGVPPAQEREAQSGSHGSGAIARNTRRTTTVSNLTAPPKNKIKPRSGGSQ